MVSLLSMRGSGASGMNPVQESMIQWAEEQLAQRREGYDLVRNYYGGNHGVKLTDRLKKFLEQQGLRFVDNYCDVVVDVVAERLNVLGFAGPNETLNDWLWGVWQANRMDGVQTTVHTEVVMLGDVYLLVDYDDSAKRPRLTPQAPEMIIPHYNPETRRIDWLSKKWTIAEVGEKPMIRLNLYYPDRVEKFIANNGVWQPFRDDEDTEWPLSWIDNAGEPLGIPLVHFRNKLLSSDYGDSEIGDIIPMQDLLNKTLVDLIMMLDGAAFGQRYTVNVTHNLSNFDISPGSIAQFFSEEGVAPEVGEWAPGDPEGLLKSIEMIVQHISSTTRTPQHLFQMSGGAPSGESLKVSESGLVKKVRRRQVSFGNSWEDAMLMAVKLESVFGSQRFADPQIETVWDDPESRNEEIHLNSLRIKKELGVPPRQLWREMGYSEAEIDQMVLDIEAQRQQDMNLGALLLQQFSNGEGV